MSLNNAGNGIWLAPHARIIDRTAHKRLPIGDDGFSTAASKSVLVDKTMLIADVLDSGYKATLFCRPRRFGKTLNMTMLKAFFEAAPAGVASQDLFDGTEIWEANNGVYRKHFASYPVVYLSLRTAKGNTWEQTYNALKNLLAAEFARHAYLQESATLDVHDFAQFDAIRNGSASEAAFAGSLLFLARLLRAHYARPVILLVDEYDAPVMAGYSALNGGYYHEVVTFLKQLLTGPLKDGGEVLAFACLTGVQRISKESIFSDLNNLVVSTPLSVISDDRFGFTDAEVAALAEYTGHSGCMEEARAWYDGYRFGRSSVYNPWSVLNYLDSGCEPRDYWGNTSGNTVLGGFVARADEGTLETLYRLCEPHGKVTAPLDLNVVFPDTDASSPALWSMLYLAGYLTTDDPQHSGDMLLAPYHLRIPNREVATLYKREIIDRFTGAVGGIDRYYRIHEALREGNARELTSALQLALDESTSFFDSIAENSAHMLMTGLLYGMLGYLPPRSNAEAGLGRFDLQLVPDAAVGMPSDYVRPLITLEFKFDKSVATDEALRALASEGLEQISAKGYDQSFADGAAVDACAERIRWGIAFAGKRVCAVCERA